MLPMLHYHVVNLNFLQHQMLKSRSNRHGHLVVIWAGRVITELQSGLLACQTDHQEYRDLLKTSSVSQLYRPIGIYRT